MSREAEEKAAEGAMGEPRFENDLVVLGLEGPLWAFVGIQ